MKLVTFMADDSRERVGAVLQEGKIVDLMLLWLRIGTKLPHTTVQREKFEKCFRGLVTLLKFGEESIPLTQKMLANFEDSKPQGVTLYAPDEITFLPPIPRPGKFIAMGRNFSTHVQESIEIWKEKGREIHAPKLPMGFIKVSTTLIGHEAPIKYPKGVAKLDYEVELALVIGKTAKDVPKEKAMDYIAGYIVFNDVSARDVQMREMENQCLLLGKNFDTCGPMGPCLVLKDEIPDAQNLNMCLRVNGEVRQNSNTRFMIYQIPVLVEYWSQMTLEPGDMIASGTPAGVASARKPDQPSWFLKPGDVIEAEIEGLGVLRNRVERL
jgi:acylpyruvate hydrolase